MINTGHFNYNFMLEGIKSIINTVNSTLNVAPLAISYGDHTERSERTVLAK